MVSLSAGVESVALSCFSKKETYPELINRANSHLDEEKETRTKTDTYSTTGLTNKTSTKHVQALTDQGNKSSMTEKKNSQHAIRKLLSRRASTGASDGHFYIHS